MAKLLTGASNSVFVKMQTRNRPGTFARVAEAIAEAGGNLGAIDIASAGADTITREITIEYAHADQAHDIFNSLKNIPGTKLLSFSDRVFMMHRGGKIRVECKVPVRSLQNLAMAYTPGVARVCTAIAEDPRRAFTHTIKSNCVAIVTDGSAVLGLGNIGPAAALPVMEGKAMLFKEFGGIDAFPICLDTQDTRAIIDHVKAIAPGFGGINLEDIASPRCFEIEQALKRELDIPVFHDDQHGTAVVTLAALYNALKVVDKRMRQIKVVVSGAGAAGIAIVKMLKHAGVKHIIACDRIGAICKGRTEHMNDMKQWLAAHSNPDRVAGSIDEAAREADVLIGVSQPGAFTVKTVKAMGPDPIVFALANPDPEVPVAKASRYARIVATGRSDYPNQINNVLCFPGLFRGALQCYARSIDETMKLAAAKAIASSVSRDSLGEEYIVPSIFQKDLSQKVADAVAKAAVAGGLTRQLPPMPMD